MTVRQDSPPVLALEATARRCRRAILEMTTRAASGHPGGSLSAIDLLVALYCTRLAIDPDRPDDPDRDRFVMSKGHASPALYAILAERGFFPSSELERFRMIDGVCQGHVDASWTPGVEFSGGSLGMGISFGVGCALAAKYLARPWTTFVMIGDGEMQEGEVWEAAMAASHHELGNLKVILDRNRIQNDDFCDEQMRMGDVVAKWRAFGWEAEEIDGHDMGAILDAVSWLDGHDSGPAILIAHTVKGKGVSFMEDNPAYHGAAASPEDLARALEEIGE